jgi:hypothetical protein
MEPGDPLGHGTPVALETAELTLMDLGLAPLTADNDADHERGEMDINANRATGCNIKRRSPIPSKSFLPPLPRRRNLCGG